MLPFLASASFLEFSPASLVVVGAALLTAAAVLVSSISTVYNRNRKLHAQTPGLLTVKRKDSDKIITLPEHYTPHAAQELLDLLA